MAGSSEHPWYAACYDRLALPAERAGLAARRARLLERARGRVLEVGGGTGLNLAHYPARDADDADAVERVDVIEPDAAMRRRLEPRAVTAPVPVRVGSATVDEAFPDPPYDTVVCCLVLCSVPDLDRSIVRLRDALAPGGRLLFLEHVRSPGWWGRFQQMATPVWGRVVPGCHLDRDVLGALRHGGFFVSDVDHFRLPCSCGLVYQAVAGTAVERVPRAATAPAGTARSARLPAALDATPVGPS